MMLRGISIAIRGRGVVEHGLSLGLVTVNAAVETIYSKLADCGQTYTPGLCAPWETHSN